ncbi:transglycosylase domain-containing protein [Pseudochrobactrum sp. MP213Fo]|uniref:transglycosylase domain-containing protein n=1 Tax=Pseudochrobactrum sp. MP213Fo TaxID=3022250 RepID=UPI003BA275D1
MASRDTKGRRIEPSFGKPDSRADKDDMRLDDSDRISEKPVKSRAAKKQSRRKSRGKKPSSGSFRWLRRLFYWALVLMLWGGIALAGLVIYIAAQMPPTSDWAIPDRPPNVKIVDVNGQLIGNRGTTGGEAIGLREMSPFIPQAVIAIEDRRFYSHYGVDPIGLARAIFTNITKGRAVQGGSTLTQQLAKNLFLSPDRTLERKLQEVMLAFWLEHTYTKDQILEMYLNRVYLGSGAYGVDAAARRYFEKTAKDVNLTEAATLAGLLKAPSRLSPARDPKAANDRARLVLAAMRDQGMIGLKEQAIAESEPPTRAASYWSGSENYVADAVLSELPKLIGETKKDVTIHTTVDLHLQKVGEEAIRDLISQNGKKMDVSQGALVSIDGTGAVRAMIGGYDYANSQFDRATEARRQPGSTFKPFVYLTSLEQGRTPDSIRNDAPIRIGKWTPSNYNGKYFGEVTLATALSHSLNSIAAQLVMEVGPQAVVDTAHRLGIKSALTANASLALGTSEVTLMEMTDAFVPFANGGYRAPVHMITKITDSDDKVLYEYPLAQQERVVTERVLSMMNAMLLRTVEDGTAKRAKFGNWPAAGKTGTSQSSRDAWFIGYTANLTTGVWFGNDDGKPTKKVTGGGLPAMAWKTFMTAAHKGVPVAELPSAYEIQNMMPGGSDELPDPSAINGQQPPALDNNGYPAPPIDDTSNDNGNWPSAPATAEQPNTRKNTTLLDIIMGNSE